MKLIIIATLLENVRPAYLYHSTQLRRLYGILSSMELRPNKSWGQDSSRLSLTRDSRLHYNEEGFGKPEITFVLDKDAITRYLQKPKPTNWMKDRTFPYGSVPPDLESMNKKDAWQFRNKYEKEEFVTKPIPLKQPFIVKMIVHETEIIKRAEQIMGADEGPYWVKMQAKEQLSHLETIKSKINELPFPVEIV